MWKRSLLRLRIMGLIQQIITLGTVHAIKEVNFEIC